jgi:hypothetical protein
MAAAAHSPPDHLAGAAHVYVGGRTEAFGGPYHVVATGVKTFTIHVGQRQKIVSVDRLKAHTMDLARCLLQRPFFAAVLPRSRPLLRYSLCHLEAAEKLHIQTQWQTFGFFPINVAFKRVVKKRIVLWDFVLLF